MDPGLEDEGGASVAPRRPRSSLWIEPPPLTEEVGESGAGILTARFGRFPLRSVELAPLSQPDASGLHGIFLDLWTDLGSVTIHGILTTLSAAVRLDVGLRRHDDDFHDVGFSRAER